MAYGLTDEEAVYIATLYHERRKGIWDRTSKGALSKRGREAAIDFIIGMSAGRGRISLLVGSDYQIPADGPATLTGAAFLAAVRGPDEAMAPIMQQASAAGWKEGGQ